MTTSFALHAHVSTASRDCDGPQYNSWVTVPNDDEIAEFAAAQERGYNDFSDLHFKERVLGNHVSFHADGPHTVEITRDGFKMSEATDEGYRSADVTWCEDPDCDPDDRTHRDVFAEAAGY
jgi:hypothetical protein